jgi:excisionase family DNA binding protein
VSLTTTEVAGVLGIGPPAVRQLARRGQLAPERPGSRPLRFAEHAVAALLQSRWWRQQRRSQISDAWAEVDAMLAAQVSGVSRCGHAEPSRDQVEG